jgi:hypothetical protein
VLFVFPVCCFVLFCCFLIFYIFVGTSNTKLPKLETQTTQLIQTTNTTNKNNNTKTKTGKFKAARLKTPELPYLPPSLTFYTETWEIAKPQPFQLLRFRCKRSSLGVSKAFQVALALQL